MAPKEEVIDKTIKSEKYIHKVKCEMTGKLDRKSKGGLWRIYRKTLEQETFKLYLEHLDKLTD